MKISIKAARVNAGMTQKAAAEKLGMCRETLIFFEKRPDRVTMPLADAMANLYDIPAEYLFFEKKNTAKSGA